MNPSKNSKKSRLGKGLEYISSLSTNNKEKLFSLLKEVQKIQRSSLSKIPKAKAIKKIMWLNRTASSKLMIGAFIGAISGLIIFSTGGIGITALGGGIGIWGWFAGTAGGTFISSLIQNYEKTQIEKGNSET